MSDGRYHRQELLFGTKGQELIEGCRVAIVGLGGLGSHVAQQLTYLGTQKFVLVDGDFAELSNLNRLVGACEDDLGRAKVEIARDAILKVSRAAIVREVRESVVSAGGFSEILGSQFVFGCVDDDAIRFVLNELCQAYETPYMDLATDIDAKEHSFGGRIVFTDGRACLVCLDALEPNTIRKALETREQAEEEDNIYGVRVGALPQAGPAVVSLNGVIASLGVTEFLSEMTGLRRANIYLEYRGSLGIVRCQTEAAVQSCYYCRTVRGKRAEANVERYLAIWPTITE
ncbi:MAG: ThiF family adenylyltransferase [Dehalococcoidia bacterium]|nr:ThiF family adenylyltransferase [Dehalococcoidia bacterium]